MAFTKNPRLFAVSLLLAAGLVYVAPFVVDAIAALRGGDMQSFHLYGWLSAKIGAVWIVTAALVGFCRPR